jgi:hypothetical protein
MDGTPYLRKVDVAAYDDYGELVEALNELFCCCSIGKLAAMLCEIDQTFFLAYISHVLEEWKLKENCVFCFVSCRADGRVRRLGARRGVRGRRRRLDARRRRAVGVSTLAETAVPLYIRRLE